MGDITTHRLLYEQFVRPELPAGIDPIYVELGNYLTDVSQFRDPFAHLSGKRAIWNTGRSQKWGLRFFFLADLVADMDGYLDTLMGIPDRGDPRGRARVPHGQLAAWFREIIFAFTLEKKFRRPTAPRDYLIEPSELRRLYDTHFTQYFPHEHLDFPPGRNTGRLDDFTAAAAPRQRIVAYLDRHLEYVSDLLTLIEKEWAHGSPPAPAMHDHLVHLGHAGHAVEDFFFHSNFTELAFAITSAPLAPFDPADTVDPHDPHGELVPPPNSPRWPRVYHRRSRRPVFAADGETFSPSTSTAADLVFTGSFGSEDIFHTLLDALGFLTVPPAFAMGPVLEHLAQACASDHRQAEVLAALALVPADHRADLPWALLHEALFPDVAPTDPDREKKEEARRKQVVDSYKCLIDTGALETLVSDLARAGQMHQLAADAVRRACAIERDMLSQYSLVGKGVLPLLLDLVAVAKERSDASKKRSEELDGKPPADHVGYDESDNGASGERIGTHSLLAKDSVRKQPLRKQTLNLAGFTISYVARTMTAEKTAGAGVTTGVDWLELLQHFVGHPEQAAGAPAAPWWQPVLGWDPAGARPSELHTVQRVDAGKVGTRAQQVAKGDLEQWYNDLTKVAEQRYRDAVASDFRLDSGINGAIVGAVAGTLAAVFSDHKTVGGVFTSLGLGMAVGFGLSYLTTTVGSAIDDRAGAVVGMLLGLTGSAVGSVAIGKACANLGGGP